MFSPLVGRGFGAQAQARSATAPVHLGKTRNEWDKDACVRSVHVTSGRDGARGTGRVRRDDTMMSSCTITSDIVSWLHDTGCI